MAISLRMGEPATLTARDRMDARQAAQRIVDTVTNGIGNPASVLIGQAQMFGVPPEELILWLSQLALEAPEIVR